MNDLELKDLMFSYDGKKKILNNVSFEIKRGKFVGIVGPNGCGKTTLLKIVCGLLKPQGGEIRISGRDINRLERKELAKKIAFVPQLMEPVEGFKVIDMVALGRTPYLDRFSFESEKDYRVVKWAIEELRIEDLVKREVVELSGGEFQRVAIARALAQKPYIMLLDEPITHLDIRYQIRILKLLRKLRKKRTIIATFHDLNMAARFCQKLILMKKGEVIAYGLPDEVLTQQNIWKAYRIKAQVRKNPRTKHAKLVLLP